MKFERKAVSVAVATALAAITVTANAAPIAVKNGTSVSRADTSVVTNVYPGTGSLPMAVELDKASTLTLTAAAVSISSYPPEETDARKGLGYGVYSAGASSLILQGETTINYGSTGINLIGGSTVTAAKKITLLRDRALSAGPGPGLSLVGTSKLTAPDITISSGNISLDLSNASEVTVANHLDVTTEGFGPQIQSGGILRAKTFTLNSALYGVRMTGGGALFDVSGDVNITIPGVGRGTPLNFGAGFAVPTGNEAKIGGNYTFNATATDQAKVMYGAFVGDKLTVTGATSITMDQSGSSFGVVVNQNGDVKLNGGVTLNTPNAYGLAISGATKGAITVTGAANIVSQTGLFSGGNGTIALNNAAARSNINVKDYAVFVSNGANAIAIQNADVQAVDAVIGYSSGTASSGKASTVTLDNVKATATSGNWLTAVVGRSVAVSLLNGSVIAGTVKAPESTVKLDGSVWNLLNTGTPVTKATATTATYTLADLNANNSTFNATGTTPTLYDVQAPVTANGSTFNLANGVVGDVLSTKAYSGSGNALNLDVTLNAGGAATESDSLVVDSVAGGPTTLNITPTAASAGAVTTDKGILVVKVAGGAAASPANAFVLGAPVENNGVPYRLVHDATDGNWYLQSAPQGQLTVTKQVNAPAGAPAFTGGIPFAVSCTNPVANFSGTIDVSSNQGSAAPISVFEGSTCTVQEGALPVAPKGYQWSAASYQQPGAPMVGGGTQTAAIINTLTALPLVTGQLQVSKTVVVPKDAPAYSGTIAFTVACQTPTATYSGSIPVASNSGTSAAITVEAGSTCSVTEQLPAAPEGYRWETPAYTQAGAITENGKATASITNTLVKADTPVVSATPVPTLGQWALILLSTILGGFAAVRVRRNQGR